MASAQPKSPPSPDTPDIERLSVRASEDERSRTTNPKEVLQGRLLHLLNNMDWAAVGDALLAEKLLSWDDIDEAKAEKTPALRRRKLIDVVVHKSDLVCQRMLDLVEDHEKAVQKHFDSARSRNSSTQQMLRLLTEQWEVPQYPDSLKAIPLLAPQWYWHDHPVENFQASFTYDRTSRSVLPLPSPTQEYLGEEKPAQLRHSDYRASVVFAQQRPTPYLIQPFGQGDGRHENRDVSGKHPRSFSETQHDLPGRSHPFSRSVSDRPAVLPTGESMEQIHKERHRSVPSTSELQHWRDAQAANLQPSQLTAEAIRKALSENCKEMCKKFLPTLLPTILFYTEAPADNKDYNHLFKEFSRHQVWRKITSDVRSHNQNQAMDAGKQFIEDVLAKCSEFALVTFAKVLADVGEPNLSAKLIFSFLEKVEQLHAQNGWNVTCKEYKRRVKLHNTIHQYSIADRSVFWGSVFQHYFNEQGSEFIYRAPRTFFCQDRHRTGPLTCGKAVSCNICLFTLQRNIVDRCLGDAAALHWLDSTKQPSTVTYAKLLHDVKKLSIVIKNLFSSSTWMGNVLLHLPQDCPELVTAILACANVGAAFWPISIRMTEEDLRKKLGQSKASLVFTSEKEGHAMMNMMKAINHYNDEVEQETRHLEHCIIVEDSKRTYAAEPSHPAVLEESAKSCELFYYNEELAKVDDDQVDLVQLIYIRPDTPFVLTNTSGERGKSDVVQHHAINYLLMAAASTMYLSGFTGCSGFRHVVVSTIGYSSMFSLTYGLIGPFLAGASVLAVDAANSSHDHEAVWQMLIQPERCCQPSILVTKPLQLMSFANYWQHCSGDVKRVEHLHKIFCSCEDFYLDIEQDIWKHMRSFLDVNNHVSLVICFGEAETANSVMTTATVPFCQPPIEAHHHKELLPMPGVAYRLEERKLQSANQNPAPHGSTNIKEIVIPKPWPGMMWTAVSGTSSNAEAAVEGDEQFTESGAYKISSGGAIITSDGSVSILPGKDDVVALKASAGQELAIPSKVVEESLKTLAAFQECIVVCEEDSGTVWVLAVPSDKRISTQEEAVQLEENLRQHVNVPLPEGQKLLHRLIQVDSLDPLRLPSGKLSHALLRERLALKGSTTSTQLQSRFPHLQDESQIGEINELLYKKQFRI